MADPISLWTRTARQNQYNQTPSRQQTISLFAACLHTHIPVPATVEALIAHNNGPNDISSIFFSAVEHLAHIPHHAETLVDIRMEIAKSPTTGEAAYPRMNWTEWKDFSWVFWEHHMDPILMTAEELHGEESGFIMPEWYDHAQHRRSVCTFCAYTLVKAERVEVWPSMWSASGVCIERFLSFDFDATAAGDLEQAKLCLPNAAVFFRVAGREVRRLCEIWEGFGEDEKGGYAINDVGKETREGGFGLERWEGWKKRWRMFEGVQGLDEEVRGMVREMLGCMERAEG